ncbi:MAG TPA: hypothetical protein VMI11_12630 [Actinomycetes bacterium]|nr:hypothetical protein [Actinomycetes bacterium]
MAGRRRAVRLLAGAAALAAAWPLAAAHAASPLQSEVGRAPGPVVVVGIPGVTWGSATPSVAPALTQVARAGATAQLSVRSVYRSTCPIDGWLTVSSARRSAASRKPPGSRTTEKGCPVSPQVSDGRVVGWARLKADAAASTYQARLGLLGDSLAAAGRCATAAGPGAGVALARGDGTIARYLPDPMALTGADVAACPLTVVDAGSVDTRGAGRPDEAAQVRAVDAVLSHVLSVLPPDATVLAASLANAAETPQLEALALAGPGIPVGGLTTSSTRQNDLVLLTDITPTVFALVGLPQSPQFVGTPVEPTGHGGPYERRRDALLAYAHKIEVYLRVTPRFFAALVPLQLLLYVSAGLALRRRPPTSPGRAPLLRFTGLAALVCGAVPIATFLANLFPWWRWPHADLALAALVLGIAVVVALVAQVARRPDGILGEAGVVAAVTAVGLALDIATGGRLQTASLMGYSPIVAGRLYGFGNVAFALFVTASLLSSVVVADLLLRRRHRRAAAVAVSAIGAATLLLDGLPRFGSDFGGMLAIAPAFGVLVLGVLGLRVTWLRLAGLVLGGAVVVAAVATLDWLRPPEQRTHLGRFVQQVLDGQLWPVVHRKIDANLSLLTSSSLGIVVPFALAFLVLVLLRPAPTRDLAPVLSRAMEQVPTLRFGLWAFTVAMVLGFLLNDSGIAIPAVGIVLAFPLIITISTRVLEHTWIPPQ